MRDSTTWRVALALLGLGAAVLFVAELEVLRVLGAITAIAGIVAAVFAIATPEYLAIEPGDEKGDR